MEKLEFVGMEIVRLYLVKLEELNEEERRVLIKTIDILNHPFFISKELT